MNYKGFKELQPEGHWIKKAGTDLFICSECGHIQDIYKKEQPARNAEPGWL